MKYKILIRSIWLLILLILPSKVQSQTWKELLDKADSFYNAGAGNLDSAIVVGQLALNRAIERFGEKDTNVAWILVRTGSYNWTRGNNSDAETDWKRALNICLQVTGGRDRVYASALHRMALLNRTKGNTALAESLYLRSIALFENIGRTYDIECARALNNLGAMYYGMERLAEAERVYKKSLDIALKVCTPGDRLIAFNFGNLCAIFKEEGNFTEVDSLFLKCLSVEEKYRPSYDLLAELAERHSDYIQAESLYIKDINFCLKDDKYNRYSPNQSTEKLASLYWKLHRYSEAESLYQAVLLHARQTIRHENLTLTALLNKLASMESDWGKYDKAESLYNQALAETPSSFMETPDAAQLLEDMARFYRKRLDDSTALAYVTRAVSIRQNNLKEFSTVMSEHRALMYSQYLNQAVNLYLSCYHDLPHRSSGDVAVATELILTSKGLVSEEIIHRRKLLLNGSSAIVQSLADSLNRIKRKLSRLYTQGPEQSETQSYKHSINSLSMLANTMESELANQSSEYRKMMASNNPTLQSVTAALPHNASLVEYFKYSYTNSKDKTEESRYLVLVLDQSRKPILHDLGSSQRIDNIIETYRRHFLKLADLKRPLSTKEQQEYQDIASKLYALIWKPIETHVKHDAVFIAPDGGLNLISFAGLPNAHGRYLIEHSLIHYLSAGRDLLRLDENELPAHGMIAFADPDYNASVADRLGNTGVMVAAASTKWTNPFATRNVRSNCTALHEMQVKPLPHTRREAEEISRTLHNKYPTESSDLFVGAGASEEQFKKKCKGHKIIHAATHGYFIRGSCPSSDDNKSVTDDVYAGENPLLESGLLLAGANLHGQGADSADAEDGILTALEVSAMDLRGTDLVVLSACETGLGEVKQGEGVYGLRRAFQMAGARTVVSSLWQVPDRETTTFMKILYSQNAKTYPELFQKAAIQRLNELRIRKQSTHPYTWAGFVATGDWKIKR